MLVISAATAIVVICSLKMFRSGFSNAPQQFVIVTFTHFFFRYDFRLCSETFLIDYFFLSILVSKVRSSSRMSPSAIALPSS